MNSREKIENDILLLMKRRDLSALPDTASKAQMRMDNDVEIIRSISSYLQILIKEKEREAVEGFVDWVFKDNMDAITYDKEGLKLSIEQYLDKLMEEDE